MGAINILLKSILAGIVIGIGGTVYLSIRNPIIGAIFFAFGLMSIVTSKFSLYTGKVGLITKIKDIPDLFITLIGNFIGTALIAWMDNVGSLKISSCELCVNKLSKTPVEVFTLSILCGVLMYLAVWQYKNTNRTEYVVFPVVIFILCGFEHSIANMFYFSLANAWGYKTCGYILLMILGNGIGAFLFRRLCNVSKNN